MPGCLIPGDLERIQQHVGDHSDEFVTTNFRVSDGAKVAARVNGMFATVSIPSIVPAQQPDGRCVFLDDNDKCKIHTVSPFGCSRLDFHMSREEGSRRVHFCVMSQLESHQSGTSYSQWCQRLYTLRLKTTPLVQRKAAMAALVNTLELDAASKAGD